MFSSRACTRVLSAAATKPKKICIGNSIRLTRRYLHDVRDDLLTLLVSRGLLQSVSVPEKKKSYGNKIGRRRLGASELSDASLDDTTQEITTVVKKMLSLRPSVYCGFDPTADSLHIGHLLPIMTLLHFQRTGHEIIALVGGATAQLGDPAGRDKDRVVSLAATQVNNNAQAISLQLETVFANHVQMHQEETDKEALPPYKIVNNMQWYCDMTVSDFYSSIGDSVKINDMLERTVVKSRLASGNGISYSEFVYQCLQSYDWLHLFKQYNCGVQLGGYDQLGNIEDGYAFIWKSLQSEADVARRRPTLMGLTVPLLTSATGEKLGKVAGNAVWLKNASSSAGLSLAEYLDGLTQADVKNFALALTFMSQESIESASESDVRKALSSHLCRLLRGLS